MNEKISKNGKKTDRFSKKRRIGGVKSPYGSHDEFDEMVPPAVAIGEMEKALRNIQVKLEQDHYGTISSPRHPKNNKKSKNSVSAKNDYLFVLGMIVFVILFAMFWIGEKGFSLRSPMIAQKVKVVTKKSEASPVMNLGKNNTAVDITKNLQSAQANELSQLTKLPESTHSIESVSFYTTSYHLPTSQPSTIPVNAHDNASVDVGADSLPPSLAPHSFPLATQSQQDVSLKQHEAEKLLAESIRVLSTNPKDSMFFVLKSLRFFEEIGVEAPSQARWVLNQSMVSQNLGMALNGFQGGIDTMTSSEDGQWLLMSDCDGRVWLWDLHLYDQPASGFHLDTVSEGIAQLRFTPSLNLAVAITKQGALRFWDLSLDQPGDCPIIWTVPRFPYSHVVISKDGHWMAGIGAEKNNNNSYRNPSNSSETTGMVHLFDLNKIAAARMVVAPTQFKAHEKTIRSLLISDDSHWLISGSDDRTIRLLNLRATIPGQEQFVLRGHDFEIDCMTVSPDGQWLVSGGRDTELRLWNLRDPKTLSHPLLLADVPGGFSMLKFSSDGMYLAAGSYDKRICIWKFNGIQKPRPVHLLVGHQALVSNLQFMKKGDSLVSQSSDGEVRIWNLASEVPSDRVVVFKNSETLPFSSVLLSEDERWLILGHPVSGTVVSRAFPQTGLKLWPLKFDEMLPCAILYAKHCQTKL